MSRRLGPLVECLDLFLDRPEADDGDLGEEALRRARLLVGVSLLLSLLTLGLASANLVSGEDVPPTSIAITFTAGVGFFLIPVLLRMTGALRVLSWVLVFGMVAAIGSAAWNAYGLYSPGLFVLPVPVLMGLILDGRRLAVVTALVGIAIIVGYYLGELDPERFRQPPLDSSNSFLLASVLITGILMIGSIGWFYESLRRQAFDQTSEALREAEAANAAKRQFLASMSHELRTPLNSVIGFSRVVREKEELSSSGDDMLARVHASGLHLLGLVDQILDVTKVEAGEIELDLEAVDLPELFRLTLRDLDTQRPREQVQLISDLPKECAPLATDRKKLRQILINLVVNAFKFTREGSVTVRLLKTDTGSAEAFEVEDTGIGIPTDKLEQIFERFVQVDRGTSRQFDGTGLGLSICKDLCDLLGYDLTVESEVDRGTTFRVAFGSDG